MEETRESQLESVEIPAAVPSFYANGIGLVASIYDMTLVFKLGSPRNIPRRDAPPVMEEQPVCVVRISLEQAKILGAIVVDAVRNYEERFEVRIAVDPERQELMEKVYGG